MTDFYITVLATIYLVLISNLFQTHTTNNNIITIGFSADLIHRDSPLSPFYNPSETNSDRLHNAFLRSRSRINHLFTRKTKNKPHDHTMVYSGGEYFMNISIGTPPVVIPGNADTGSDLTWTQCKPCTNCFKQLSPLFDPKQSSTYIELPCESLPCKAVGKYNFCTPQNLCEYNYSYADGAFTNGLIATDTISIGSVSLPDIFFGCGHNNGGTFDELGSGIIGLGRGPLSFINQFSPSIGHKFSYCLVPTTSLNSPTSKIYFGNDGVVSGDDVVSTPLVANGTDISYYYLVLQGVSVGEKRITTTLNYNDQNWNIIMVLDSGTTYTFLPHIFYQYFLVTIDNAIRGKRVKDPNGILNLCYQTDEDIEAPIVTFHFSGNANVQLRTENTFIRVTEHVVCLTIAPTYDVPVYGNLSQKNFLVGYDLDNQTVAFKRTDCSAIQ